MTAAMWWNPCGGAGFGLVDLADLAFGISDGRGLAMAGPGRVGHPIAAAGAILRPVHEHPVSSRHRRR